MPAPIGAPTAAPVPTTATTPPFANILNPVSLPPTAPTPNTTGKPSNTGVGQSPNEVSRATFPYFNAFRPWIIDEFGRRKLDYPLSPQAPFVRLTSCKKDPAFDYVFFTLGLHGLNIPVSYDPQNGLITEAANINLFDLSYGGGFDVVGYARDLSNPNQDGTYPIKMINTAMLGASAPPNVINTVFPQQVQAQLLQQRATGDIISHTEYAGGAHPVPGITEVVSNLRNYYQPLQSVAKFKCYNRAQLEFLRNHFMIFGSYVVLEWGNMWSSYQPMTILNFGDVDGVRQDIVNAVNKGRSYIFDTWSRPNNGNYMFTVGTISNYSVNIEAHTGIYNCEVTITSVGEVVAGLNNHMTRPNKATSPTVPQHAAYTTFHDYFQFGGGFDALIEEYRGQKLESGLVANYTEHWGGKAPPITTIKPTNPLDYRFVSWIWFTTKLMPALIAIVSNGREVFGDNTPSNTQILSSFLDLAANNADPTTLAQANTRNWVGDNPFLKSTDPDVMLIIRADMANSLTSANAQTFQDNGNFDDETFGYGYRALLNTGVWLNAGMIRDCFLGTTTFTAAIRSILEKMNTASANYWNLELDWDEEHAQWVVIDENHTAPVDTIQFYMFNVGAKGELLNVNLESAFPPETISQMALYAYWKDLSKPDQEKLRTQFPAIGSTSTYVFSLNWTDLIDITGQDINAQPKNAQFSSQISQQVAPIRAVPNSIGNTAGQTTSDRGLARVSSTRQSVGSTSTLTFTSPAQGQDFSTANVIAPATPAPTVLTDNNNPTPTLSPSQAALLARSTVYDSQINAALAALPPSTTVPPLPIQLVKAVIANESQFHIPSDGIGGTIYRPEPSLPLVGQGQLEDGSYGPMQILYSTAIKSGYSPTAPQSGLEDPATNIMLGTKYLNSCWIQANGDPSVALAIYQGGSPLTSFNMGRRPIGVQYVNEGMKHYNTFNMQSGLPTFGPQKYPQPGAVDQPSGDPQLDETSDTQFQSAAEVAKKLDNWTSRYGYLFVYLCEPVAAAMLSKISYDGYVHHSPNNVNSYVAPFPLTSNVTLDLVGIGGISIGDGFYVDKLPFVFEQSGIWQVTDVIDKIDSKDGWRTSITGYFKLCYLNGDGPKIAPITGPTATNIGT